MYGQAVMLDFSRRGGGGGGAGHPPLPGSYVSAFYMKLFILIFSDITADVFYTCLLAMQILKEC